MSEDRKDTNPKDAVATTRLDMSLFPDSATAYGALAFVEGDQKYGGYNWRVAGVKSSVYVAACRRHLAKWLNGEDDDPKTRVPHLANALACIAILIDAVEQGNLNDDRPPKQRSALFARFEGVVKHLHTIFPRQVDRYRARPAPSREVTPSSWWGVSQFDAERMERERINREANARLDRAMGLGLPLAPTPPARVKCEAALKFGMAWDPTCKGCNPRPPREQKS